MRSVPRDRSSRIPIRGEYGGKDTGRNRISKLSGTLSWLAMRTGRRRKDPRTRVIFPIVRLGSVAARGFQRGSPPSSRIRSGTDRARAADVGRYAASGRFGALPLREIAARALPGRNLTGTRGLNRGSGA